MHPQTLSFLDKLQNIFLNKELIKLTLTGKKDKNSELKKIIVTAVELKKGYCFNFVYRNNTNDITKNYDLTEGLDNIQNALECSFLNAEISATHKTIYYNHLPNGKIKIRVTDNMQPVPVAFTHNKIKNRLIEPSNNIYLRELNITNANGEVRREMSDKFKQINKYIELLEPELKELDKDNNYHIVDMGAGKGYLTFALYDYIAKLFENNIKVTGVEYRPDLVQICNTIALKCNFTNLQFIEGTIEKTQIDKIDILIALHACNTATDDAIFRGIQANATMIVCAPCCHKQIRKSFNVSDQLLGITKYGILEERQAEIITDAIRAQILEAYGYKTKVVEFISSEHTPKNVMIVARKTMNKNIDKQKILNNIAAIKSLFGIKKHYLETLLGI